MRFKMASYLNLTEIWMAQCYAIILTTQREIPKTIKQKCPIFGFFGLWIRGNPNRPVQKELFVGLLVKKIPMGNIVTF